MVIHNALLERRVCIQRSVVARDRRDICGSNSAQPLFESTWLNCAVGLYNHITCAGNATAFLVQTTLSFQSFCLMRKHNYFHPILCVPTWWVQQLHRIRCWENFLLQFTSAAPVHGHTKIRRHHGTHGTDFIGCRRGKGGASTGTGAVRDQCHVTKLKELYRHPGATVCWQKYSPYCYMQRSRTKDGNQQCPNNK